MKVIEINKTRVELYSSIKELPIHLRKKFDGYMLQEIGIGSSMEDIDKHLENAFLFIANDKKEDAMEELKNLRFNFFSMLNNVSYSALAFGCLVKSIGDKEIKDYSSEGLALIAKQLSDIGITDDQLKDVIDGVKKNLIPKGNYIFQSTSAMI
jgi:hypothetical protein